MFTGLFLVNPSDHVLDVPGILPQDFVLLKERLNEGGGAPLLPNLPDLLQPPLPEPGPHVLRVDAV